MSIINNKTDETPLNGIYKNTKGDRFKFTVQFVSKELCTKINLKIKFADKKIGRKIYREFNISKNSYEIESAIDRSYYDKPHQIFRSLINGLFVITINDFNTEIRLIDFGIVIIIYEDIDKMNETDIDNDDETGYEINNEVYVKVDADIDVDIEGENKVKDEDKVNKDKIEVENNKNKKNSCQIL